MFKLELLGGGGRLGASRGLIGPFTMLARLTASVKATFPAVRWRRPPLVEFGGSFAIFVR
jgi:hypothetical protein